MLDKLLPSFRSGFMRKALIKIIPQVCFCLQEVVTGILPISYEDEIVQKRTQILRDPLQILLVFPEDDVVVSDLTFKHFRVAPQND